MAHEQTTIGEVSARLIKLMTRLGGTNELMFAAGTVEELQHRAYTQLPAAFNELLDTIDMLAQDLQHDREALRRERDRGFAQCERWESHAAKLMNKCREQDELIDRLNEPGSE